MEHSGSQTRQGKQSLKVTRGFDNKTPENLIKSCGEGGLVILGKRSHEEKSNIFDFIKNKNFCEGKTKLTISHEYK